MKKITLGDGTASILLKHKQNLRHEFATLAWRVMLESDGQPVGVIIPLIEYKAFQAWQEAIQEPWPSEPPRTAEGDQEGLAAVERIRTMFPPLDAETARYIAESHDFSLDYSLPSSRQNTD